MFCLSYTNWELWESRSYSAEKAAQPRAQPLPADVQGQHPKFVFHLVFSCWGSAGIDGDSIFIPGGKAENVLLGKDPHQTPQKRGAGTIPSFTDLPLQSKTVWQLNPDPLHGPVWLLSLGFAFPALQLL